MSLPGPHFTYEDYKLLPEDKRCEIIEGDLLMTPSPAFRHQAIQIRLGAKLLAFADASDLGQVVTAPMDVVLSPENVVQPDVLFVAKAHSAIIDQKDGVQGAPDLAVEILSPSTAPRDQILKRKLYGRYGVQEYWIVDPEAQSVEVLSMTGSGLETWRRFTGDETLGSLLLPGLSIRLGDIFKV